MRSVGAARRLHTLAARRVGFGATARCCSSKAAQPLLRQGEAEWELKETRPRSQARKSRDACSSAAFAAGDSVLLLRSRGEAGFTLPLAHAQQMLLPRGYPHSVAPGFGGYMGWLGAGLFAHSFTVMVSTNALLSGFFAEMSAASWLMKDLLPPLVAGALASRIRSLEANPKRWLGAACFANSLLGVTEFMIPHLLPKESWMVLAICTNVGKMTGYLVIGASRAVLQKTLASGENLGEVTARLGTLGMLMHCFGAATALTLVQFLDFWGQFAALSAGAAVGFYAPVRASECVVMSTVTAVSLRRLVARWAEARAVVHGRGGPRRWACPSPTALHDELAARWSWRYSLAARAGAWRELLTTDASLRDAAHVLRAGSASLLVGPELASAADVSALAAWRAAMRAADADPPAAWTLGAGGDGKLLLVYEKVATPADVIEGFAVAWLAAHAAAPALGGGRLAAEAALASASVESLAAWRRDAASLRDAMDAAGWQCDGCNVDDPSRRVEWADGSTDDPSWNVADSFSKRPT